MNKISLLTQLTCIIATTHASLVIGADYSEKEQLFAAVYLDAATNPTDLNLTELRKAIIPKEVSATCIVKEVEKIANPCVLEQNLSIKMNPALQTVAQECPYAFYIANNNRPVEFTLTLLTVGFICPHLFMEHNGEYKKIPIANLIIRDLQASRLSAAKASEYMKLLLTSGLNPFYVVLFSDGHKNLYQIVQNRKLTIENQNMFIALFNAATKNWSEEEKADTKSMFKRGSPFNWTEKGLPFVIATPSTTNLQTLPQKQSQEKTAHYCTDCARHNLNPSHDPNACE
jgi:hypothetical protein